MEATAGTASGRAKVHEELQASTVRQLQVPVTKYLLFVYSWNGKRRLEKAKD